MSLEQLKNYVSNIPSLLGTIMFRNISRDLFKVLKTTMKLHRGFRLENIEAMYNPQCNMLNDF